MSIAQNSFTLRFALALWALFKQAGRCSATARALNALEAWFRRQAAGSAICTFVWREGAVPKAWPQSVSCGLFTGILNIPCAAVKWIYQAGRRVWDASVSFRLVSALGGASFFFVGLFMLFMLAAPHTVWNNIYGFAAAAGLLCLFVLGSAARPKRRLELDRLGPYMVFYMAFLCIALAGSLSTRLSMRFFFFHLTGFLLVLVLVSAVRKYEQLQLTVALAVTGISIAALYGCYQGYVGVEVVASQQDMTLNKDMPGRIYSFFDNPNNFAEVLVMFFPLVGALTLNARGWRGRLCGLVALGLGAAAIGMTYSRSSWLGLALAAVIFLALMDWRFLPAMLVVGGCAIPFLPRTILNRILTIGNMKDSSARYRIAIYEDTARLLKDYGVTGVGLGSDVTRRVFLHYPTLYDGNYPIHTHNNYLQMWAEIGIFGLLAYLGLMVVQVRESLRAFRKADKQLRRILAAALGGLVGLLAIGLVEYTWFYPRNMFLFWILFAVIASAVKLIETEAGRAA